MRAKPVRMMVMTEAMAQPVVRTVRWRVGVAMSIQAHMPMATMVARASAAPRSLLMSLVLAEFLPDSAAAWAAQPSRRAPNQMLSQETRVDHMRLIIHISAGMTRMA